MTEAGALRAETADFLARAGADEGILFGSRARGDQLRCGDVDLIVLSRRFAGVPFIRRLVGLQSLWRSPLFLEALAYTPEEWALCRGTSGVLAAAAREGIRIRPRGRGAAAGRI
jgi:hypothetical protein